MAKRTYTFLPDELSEVADKTADSFIGRGFKVHVEKREIGFPFPPTLACTRTNLDRVIIEVVGEYDDNRFGNWVAYGRSCNKEIKIYMAVAEGSSVTKASLVRLRSQGLGLLVAGPSGVNQELEAVDLSIKIALPELRSLPTSVRPLLGAAYDHFNASRWREGFEDACKVLDVEARKYLKKWTKTGRIRFIEKTKSKSRVFTMTAQQIDKMTIGGLALRFSQIQAQTSLDKIIGQALAKINKDRVNLTHHKWKNQTEVKLRANVPQHMWIIIHALTELSK
jgi:hypothetical protein